MSPYFPHTIEIMDHGLRALGFEWAAHATGWGYTHPDYPGLIYAIENGSDIVWFTDTDPTRHPIE